MPQTASSSSRKPQRKKVTATKKKVAKKKTTAKKTTAKKKTATAKKKAVVAKKPAVKKKAAVKKTAVKRTTTKKTVVTMEERHRMIAECAYHKGHASPDLGPEANHRHWLAAEREIDALIMKWTKTRH